MENRVKPYAKRSLEERLYIPPALDLGELPGIENNSHIKNTTPPSQMNFTIDSKSFKDAISTASRCVSKKPSLPVLSCIHVDARDGHLILSSSDVDRTMTVRVPAEISAEGAFLCAASRLLIAIPSEGSVNITCAHGRVAIKGERKKADLLTMPLDEWTDGLKHKPGQDISSPDFRAMIASAFSNVEQTSGREAIAGVRVEGGKNCVIAIGTNGKSMVKAQIEADWTQPVCTIPMAICDDMLSLLPGDGGVNVNIAEQQVSFASEMISYCGKILDLQFPAWKPLLERRGHYERATINRNALMDCILQVSPMDESGASRVEWEHDGKVVHLTSRTMAGDVVSDSFEAGKAKPHKIALNSRYLLRLLRTLADDEIVMVINEDPANPYFVESKMTTAVFTTLRV